MVSLLRFRHPVGHMVSPARQALQSVPAALQALGQVVVVVLHAWLASHIAADVLTPLLQLWAAPHRVPTGLLLLTVQTEDPVAQEVVPLVQGLLGVQVSPAVHETQLPVLHTRFVPQLLPSATDVPLSLHVAMPVLQVRVPL